jgi:hypothetical protein
MEIRLQRLRDQNEALVKEVTNEMFSVGFQPTMPYAISSPSLDSCCALQIWRNVNSRLAVPRKVVRGTERP